MYICIFKMLATSTSQSTAIICPNSSSVKFPSVGRSAVAFSSTPTTVIALIENMKEADLVCKPFQLKRESE